MSEPDSSVIFRCGSAKLDRAGLRTFARDLQREVAGGRPFDALITRDAELQQLNRDFLGHDYATDVLSFPGSSESGPLGDLAISIDRAREQALERAHELEVEVRVLMLHGVLHLLGMDHERDEGRMRRAESRWRKTLGLPAGLIERERA